MSFALLNVDDCPTKYVLSHPLHTALKPVQVGPFCTSFTTVGSHLKHESASLVYSVRRFALPHHSSRPPARRCCARELGHDGK